MKQGSNSRRSRGRGNGKRPQKNHNFDSAGPEGRVRGNAQQVYEKYLALARDAMTAGDRIATENYFQHAEHYLRVLMAQDNSDGRVDAFRQRQRSGLFGEDEFDEGGDGEGDDDRPSDVSGNRAPPGERNFQGDRNQNEGRNEGRHEGRNQNEGRNRNDGRNQGEGRSHNEARPPRDDQREGQRDGQRDAPREGQREGQRDNQREGRPQGEGRAPREPREPREPRQHNNPPRAAQGEDARAESPEGAREGGGRDRGGREGSGNGRRVPIEKANEQGAQRAAEPKTSDDDHEIADDDGVRRTIAI